MISSTCRSPSAGIDVPERDIDLESENNDLENENNELPETKLDLRYHVKDLF